MSSSDDFSEWQRFKLHIYENMTLIFRVAIPEESKL